MIAAADRPPATWVSQIGRVANDAAGEVAQFTWSLSRSGRCHAVVPVAELGTTGEGHMVVGTLTMHESRLHFADSTGMIPCVLGCVPPAVWVGANDYLAVDQWTTFQDQSKMATLEIGRIHCCGTEPPARPPVECWKYEEGRLVDAGCGAVPDPDAKRQVFSIQGVLAAVSPLCKASGTGSTSHLVSFFLATVAAPHDAKLHVQLLFQGAQACCWHQFLQTGSSYYFKRLIHSTLFKNTPGSIRVIAATGAPPGSASKGTVVQRAQRSGNSAPVPKRLCCSQLLVECEGSVTADHGWGLYTLDSRVVLLLGAATLATTASRVRLGARVRVSNAHKLYDQRGVHVALGCCMRTQLQLLAPGTAAVGHRDVNRTAWLRLVKHVSLSGALWMRRVHDNLAHWLLDTSDTLITQTAMLTQLATACGVLQHRRDVYQEFASHDSCCADAQLAAGAAGSVAVQPVNQLVKCDQLLQALQGHNRKQLLSTELYQDWPQVAVLGQLVGCPLTGSLLLQCSDAMIPLELAGGNTLPAAHLGNWCVIVGFTLVVEPRISSSAIVAPAASLKLLPTVSSLGVSPEPVALLNKTSGTTFCVRFALVRKGRVVGAGFSGMVQPAEDCAPLGLKRGAMFTVRFIELRSYSVLRAGESYMCTMWHSGNTIEAAAVEANDATPAPRHLDQQPLGSLSAALCCTMTALRAGSTASFVCSVIQLDHYAESQVMLQCTDAITELGRAAVLCPRSQLPHFSICSGCHLEFRGVLRSLSPSHRLIFKVIEHTDIRVIPPPASKPAAPTLPKTLLRSLYSAEQARFSVQVCECSVVSLSKFSAKLQCSSCDTVWHCIGRCCDDMKLKPRYSAVVLASDGSAQVLVSLHHELVLQVVAIPNSQLAILDRGMRSCSKLPIVWQRDGAAECGGLLSRLMEHVNLMRSMRLVFQPSLLNTRPEQPRIMRFSLERGAHYETHALPTLQVDGIEVHAREAKMMARDLVASLLNS